MCETDALFFVELRDLMRHAECGPFALPAKAHTPARRFLPWGAQPTTPTRPRPDSTFPVDDGDTYIADTSDGRLVVHQRERVLFREPGTAGVARMGLLAGTVSTRASLVAYARSLGPLVVGDLATGRVRQQVPARGGNFVGAAIAPRGDRVAFLLDEAFSQRRVCRVLDLVTGKVHAVDDGRDFAPHDLLFADPPRLLLAVSQGGMLTAHGFDGGAPRWRASVDPIWRGARRHAVSPDGKHVLVLTKAGQHAELLALTTGTVCGKVDVPAMSEAPARVPLASFSADGRQFAWVLGDGRLARASVDAPDDVRLHLGALAEFVEIAVEDDRVVTTERDGARLAWPAERFALRASLGKK